MDLVKGYEIQMFHLQLCWMNKQDLSVGESGRPMEGGHQPSHPLCSSHAHPAATGTSTEAGALLNPAPPCKHLRL